MPSKLLLELTGKREAMQVVSLLENISQFIAVVVVFYVVFYLLIRWFSRGKREVGTEVTPQLNQGRLILHFILRTNSVVRGLTLGCLN